MDHTVVTLQTHHTRHYLVAFTKWRHQCSDNSHLISAYIYRPQEDERLSLPT